MDLSKQAERRADVLREAMSLAFRQLRKRSGLTQQGLATYMGVSQSLVSRLEAGERGFRLETVCLYALAFQTTEADIITRISKIAGVLDGLELSDD